MGATKEADLISAVLRYAVCCLADGDREALRAMNFGPEEIEALRGMHLGDLPRLASLGAHCLEIDLNRQVYWTLLAHLQRERDAEALQRDLIKADAPFEMMQTFFGLSSREYTRLRRLLTPDPAIGRPPEPDEATSHALWRAWSEHTKNDPTAPLTPEEYLALSHETGASMRAVWHLTQRWAECGDVSHEGAAAVTSIHAADPGQIIR